VALILSIVAAVKKAHRGVAIAGLAIAVLGPAITGAIGASEGANSLASRFESVAEDASGWLTDALRGSDLPDWAEKLIEGTEFYNELDP
jgi:hypothetical protein